MNSVRVIAIVEGRTESLFIKDVAAPYLAHGGVYISPAIIGKGKSQGGNVTFDRAKKDIGTELKKDKNAFVTTVFDYYGLGAWLDLERKPAREATETLKELKEKTADKIAELFPNSRSRERFIPYFSMYEFEALLFSDSEALAKGIGCEKEKVDEILAAFDNQPEAINDDPKTAPSKRIEELSLSSQKSPYYKKTTNSVAIAQDITIDKIRQQCPIFNDWLAELENLGKP